MYTDGSYPEIVRNTKTEIVSRKLFGNNAEKEVSNDEDRDFGVPNWIHSNVRKQRFGWMPGLTVGGGIGVTEFQNSNRTL